MLLQVGEGKWDDADTSGAALWYLFGASKKVFTDVFDWRFRGGILSCIVTWCYWGGIMFCTVVFGAAGE